MSDFSIDWLDLREEADRRARDSGLREQAVKWLQDSRLPLPGPIVVDLGAGTGSTLRALAVPSRMPLTWRLVDHDQTLLAEARRRHDSTTRIEICAADLSHIDELPLNGARLVTASALFDLVSAEFIEAIAKALQTQCQQSAVGIYAALNYDGSTRWTPAHPLDDIVLLAFNRDQRRDKGFGPALGPEAGNAMHRLFRQAGFDVYSASSPWVLDGADQHMVYALITGIASAVAGSPGLDPNTLQDWVRFRQSKAASGTCAVGHTDLLALPV
ncbi:MAG: hypothetical protein ACI87W_002762 [Halieaceae bacterium]|jgi:hypothetical protein